MDQSKIDDGWLERMVKEVGLRVAVNEATLKINAELEKLGLSGIVTCNLGLMVKDENDRELAATGVYHFRRFNHTKR